MAIYACSDLHGRYDLWCKIKEYLQTDDRLIFLGDAADRNAQGWHIIKEMLADPRVIYLKGNHEDMLVKAMVEYQDEEVWWYEARDLLVYNGGYQTYYDWIEEGADRSWITVLRNLPTYYKYLNTKGQEIFLSHSGSRNINNVQMLLWDRAHIISDTVDSFKENEFVIHGHTPVSSIRRLDNIYLGPGNVVYYCDGHKIDIDIGAARHPETVLFDLDTFDEVVIRNEEFIL